MERNIKITHEKTSRGTINLGDWIIIHYVFMFIKCSSTGDTVVNKVDNVIFSWHLDQYKNQNQLSGREVINLHTIFSIFSENQTVSRVPTKFLKSLWS